MVEEAQLANLTWDIFRASRGFRDAASPAAPAGAPGAIAAPDLVNRHLPAERPGQLYVGDITYIPTG
ncbi:MAG: hypothetical protein ACP5VR_13590 [Acidimicrobiales bacterium]